MKKLTIQNKQVTIEKLKLRKLAELFGVLEELPKVLGDLTELDESNILSALPQMISKTLPEVIKALAIATPLTEEELDDVAIDELVELLVTVFEVNELRRVGSSLKKLLPSSPPASGSIKLSTAWHPNTDGAEVKSTTSI